MLVNGYHQLVNKRCLIQNCTKSDDIILINNQPDASSFFVCVYFKSIHVSSTLVLIIWRRFGWNNQTSILDGHLHKVTYTRCRIDIIESPDDEHRSARNM